VVAGLATVGDQVATVDPPTSTLRTKLNRLVDGPPILFVAMSFNNVAIFGFHAMISRILGPDRYGALGALLALTLLFNVATGAIVVAVIRVTAGFDQSIAWELGRPGRMLAAIIGIVGLVAAGLSPLLAHYLHLKSVIPALLLVAFMCVVLIGVLFRGVLLGQRQFKPVAAAFAAAGFTRLVLGLALAPTVGISGGIAAYVLAEGASATIMVRAHRRRLAGVTRTRRSLVLPGRSLSLPMAAYAGMYALSATDTFLARHLLPGSPAGLYVAASTAGSIALWLPYNVTTSSFPGLAGEAHDHSSHRRTFMAGLLAVTTLTVTVSLAMVLLPHLTVGVLFGSAFAASAPVLVLLAVSNGAQGIAGFLLHHQLAHHRTRSLIPWLGLVAMAIGIYRFHQSPRQVALVAVVVSVALLGAMAIGSVLLERNRPDPCPARPRVGIADPPGH
jgi:O-antigen/teichoic acid export membrane protein